MKFFSVNTAAIVALRKESVDRNDTLELEVLYADGSLSARRAWIEIMITTTAAAQSRQVALRKESVDRNMVCSSLVGFGVVALRKESVDRNRRPTGRPA